MIIETAPRYWALDRLRDVSDVSGTGRVAYAYEFPSQGVLLVWATNWVTVDWRPDVETVRAIHGHDGATVLTELSGDPQARARADELLTAVLTRAMWTLLAGHAWLNRLGSSPGPGPAPVGR